MGMGNEIHKTPQMAQAGFKSNKDRTLVRGKVSMGLILLFDFVIFHRWVLEPINSLKNQYKNLYFETKQDRIR